MSNMDVPKWVVFLAWLLAQVIYLVTGRRKMMRRWEWKNDDSGDRVRQPDGDGRI